MRSHHFSAILTLSTPVDLSSQGSLDLLKQAIQRAELRHLGELSVTFVPQGISAVLILEESHVALHVWPEEGKVSVDIHVCDYYQNNLPKAERLAEILAVELTGTFDRTQWRYTSVVG